MAYATATFSDVSPFDIRIVAVGEYRRVLRAAIIGLGTLAAGCILVISITLGAGWMIGAALSTNPHFRARSGGPETIALASPRRGLIGTGQFAGASRLLSHSAYERDLALRAEPARIAAATPAPIVPVPLPRPRVQVANSVLLPRPMHPPPHPAKPETTEVRVAELTPSITPPPLPAPPRSAERPDNVPLPEPRPMETPPIAATREIARTTATSPAPPLVTGSLPPPETQKRLTVQQALDGSISLPGPSSRTAVYDIAAHTVYLPNGETLEAHSGLGSRMDDPRYVDAKRRGPTPPNIYNLTLRKQLFHGVRAIRLNPVDEDRMYGRDGMLAHTYMLGPTGQSFGCVSFRNYPKFLHAFLNGDIDRLVVVPRLGTKPSLAMRTRRKPVDDYAFNIE
jgi:hypothetical protein